ncbi:hypothetical protein ACIBP6_32895 [Nonomuraea terrae]|nr:hypothetical protein [Nonomuraea terrae]
MARHEDPKSPKAEDFDPKKHGGVGSNGDQQKTASGKHADKGKGDKK